MTARPLYDVEAGRPITGYRWCPDCMAAGFLAGDNPDCIRRGCVEGLGIVPDPAADLAPGVAGAGGRPVAPDHGPASLPHGATAPANGEVGFTPDPASPPPSV